MSETVSATITKSEFDKSGTFDDGKQYQLYNVALASDAGGETRSGEMWIVGDAKPPTEGEEGSFIVEPKAKGGGFKIRRAPRNNGQRGGARAGGGGVGYSTPPEDAQRMSRSTALQAAVAHPKLAEADSDTLLRVARAFADFIYNGPKEEAS